MVCLLEIQQFMDFLETFPRNFRTVSHCFKNFAIFVESKVPYICPHFQIPRKELKISM